MPLDLWRKAFRIPSPAYFQRPVFGLADFAVGLRALTVLYVTARVGGQSLVKFSPPEVIPSVSLDPRDLPNWAARSTLRMFVALAASVVFHLDLWIHRCTKQAGGARPHN